MTHKSLQPSARSANHFEHGICDPQVDVQHKDINEVRARVRARQKGSTKLSGVSMQSRLRRPLERVTKAVYFIIVSNALRPQIIIAICCAFQ